MMTGGALFFLRSGIWNCTYIWPIMIWSGLPAVWLGLPGGGVVVERVEQQFVRAANLCAELRPYGEQDHLAPSDRDFSDRSLAEQALLAKNPSAHQRIR